MDLQDQGVVESGCSRHMTGNVSYLTDYEEIDGGYVAFGGNPKGGKITEKGTIKTEAVNTACYVQNRELVVKPHNKTPYEHFHGRTPTLSFLRPFGCPVTILNTIDHLGKFNGKADEGFFVGYSLNSKAFRVFNSRTRIVEENMHIRFSEITPNVVGSGPDWLFDIDALTRKMNYEPIVAGTQSNVFAGTKASDNADLKSSNDDGSKPLSDDGKKVDEDPRKENECNDQEKEDNVNSTNNVNTVSLTVNTADVSTFNFLRDDKDDGAMAHMNNLDTTIQEEPKKTLVDSPNGKRAIGTKWGFMNKKDERGIVIRNKARLVAQRYTQVEGIDYDEVFAPVARIRAIRLFLAYALFKDFVVYQMDVKSAFLYGKIKEEVCVCQSIRFKDPDFPDRVYKVEKALFTKVKTTSTSMETQKYLLKDEDGKEVDVRMYRSMIGSLMFLTSSKPDIMFAVCACARYQVNPKVSHLHAMKRIFRKPKRKDTQVPQPSDPTDNVAYEAVHKELGDSLVRVATTASSLEAEQDSGNITKTKFKATPNEPSSQRPNLGGGPWCQETIREVAVKKANDEVNVVKEVVEVIKTAKLIVDVAQVSTAREVSTASVPVSTASIATTVNAATTTTTTTITTVDDVTLAQALEEIKSTKPKVKGLVIQELGKSTTTISSQQSHDKGKGILIEPVIAPMKPMKRKEQIWLDDEAALKLQAAFDEEKRLAREKAEKVEEANIALIETWDDIQAKIDADHQLAERMQAQEQEELSIAEKATLFQQLLEKRRKYFATKREEEKRNKPPTQAQQRKIMCTYLKNMEGYMIKHLKMFEFDRIEKMFDRAFRGVNTFKDFKTELVEGKEKRAREELVPEITKKQKVEDEKERVELK
nr:retrovirus-related Pol polyprotein from transposon TNT 1-94 [Tanacetum cinerariifolium]